MITLTQDELLKLTGYQRPGDQLRELHQLGYVRAYLNRLGEVILDRAHYIAVCEGRYARPLEPLQNARPKVRTHAKVAA